MITRRPTRPTFGRRSWYRNVVPTAVHLAVRRHHILSILLASFFSFSPLSPCRFLWAPRLILLRSGAFDAASSLRLCVPDARLRAPGL